LTRRALFAIAAVVVVGAAATALALNGDDERSVPTEAQARTLLEAKIRQALAGDVRAYCADTFSPEMCQSQWERLGQEALPRTRPRVIDVREQDGYRVLRVCGTDGRDQPYQTDFVVGLENGNLTLVLPPVFWTGASFSGVHGDDAPPQREGVKTTPTAPCS
jgi:hypothetical protein